MTVALAIAALTLSQAATAAAVGDDCSLPDGWDSVAAAGSDTVIFGETHGTAQAPAMVGQTACALAERGESVLIGVELQNDADDALQRAWADDAPDFALRLPDTMPGWKGRMDGVASRAMLVLLVRLHALKAKGADISVVAFNGTPAQAGDPRFADLPAQGPHEAAQAENIERAANARDFDHVLVLSGDFHAAESPARWGDDVFDPMALRLADRAPVTLRMVNGPGTAWNCIAMGSPDEQDAHPRIDCGAHPMTDTVKLTGNPRIILGPVPGSTTANPGAYDGYFFTGPVTASPPAAPVKDFGAIEGG